MANDVAEAPLPEAATFDARSRLASLVYVACGSEKGNETDVLADQVVLMAIRGALAAFRPTT